MRNTKIFLLLLMVGLVGAFGGLVSTFRAEAFSDTDMHYENQLAFAKRLPKEAANDKIMIKSDPESIGRGKNLFDSKCKFCHLANSTETIVGPGLKGILKNKKLPVSKMSATPENIIRQVKQPFNRMPSFEYFTDDEMSDIMAYLNTL